MSGDADKIHTTRADSVWLDTSALTIAIPSKHAAGSVLFFSNTRLQPSPYAVALRIDNVEEDGDLVESLMWLVGDPWNQGGLSGCIDGCRDHHLNEKQVLGLSPKDFRTRIELGISAPVTDGSELGWSNGVGLVATGQFGFRLVGGVKRQFGQPFPRLVDPDNWTSHDKFLASRPVAREWIRDWRIALRKPDTNDLLASFAVARSSAA